MSAPAGSTPAETRRAAVEAALLHRYDPGRFALSEPAREWRGLSLIEMARGWLEAEGVRVRGLSRDEIATRALHSTSDFPAILAGVTNKTLRERLRDRTADLPGDRPAHHRRRLQAGAPAAARRGAAAREGQPVRRVQARHHRRGAGDLPHRDLRQGDRHHPPGADQRRPRRLHPGAGALRHLGGDAGERRRLGHLHRQPGDGRRQRRSSTPATRTSPAPARRSTSPGSPRRAPPWRSSAGSTARRS